MRLFRRGETASTLDLLVAGLGNPGREHERDRHNVGWMVVDELARRREASFKSKFNGRLAETRFDEQPRRAAEARDVHERIGPLDRGRRALLQGSGRGRARRPRRRRPGARAGCRPCRRRARRAQRAALDRTGARDSGVSPAADRRRAARAAAILATSPTTCCRPSSRTRIATTSLRERPMPSRWSFARASRRRSAGSTERGATARGWVGWHGTARQSVSHP